MLFIQWEEEENGGEGEKKWRFNIPQKMTGPLRVFWFWFFFFAPAWCSKEWQTNNRAMKMRLKAFQLSCSLPPVFLSLSARLILHMCSFWAGMWDITVISWCLARVLQRKWEQYFLILVTPAAFRGAHVILYYARLKEQAAECFERPCWPWFLLAECNVDILPWLFRKRKNANSLDIWMDLISNISLWHSHFLATLCAH